MIKTTREIMSDYNKLYLKLRPKPWYAGWSEEPKVLAELEKFRNIKWQLIEVK